MTSETALAIRSYLLYTIPKINCDSVEYRRAGRALYRIIVQCNLL